MPGFMPGMCDVPGIFVVESDFAFVRFAVFLAPALLADFFAVLGDAAAVGLFVMSFMLDISGMRRPVESAFVESRFTPLSRDIGIPGMLGMFCGMCVAALESRCTRDESLDIGIPGIA